MKGGVKLGLLVLLTSLAAVADSCNRGGTGESGSSEIILWVAPSANGGFRGGEIPATGSSGKQVFYPGVLCYRVNHLIYFSDIRINFDASIVSFNIASLSAMPIDTLWFKLRAGYGATLASVPEVVNGRGQNIFVVGPLAAGSQVTMTVRVNPPASGGYLLYFDFLDVKDRVAFSSDRADPGAPGVSEIFTMQPNGSGLFQVTHDSAGRDQDPVWSPQGEWIAFEGQVPADCNGDTVMSPQVFLVHPDGSNLTRVSQGIFSAGSPTFNPDGQLLAYECRPQCDVVSTESDLCLYSLRNGSQVPLFSGLGFDQDQLGRPRWSPDGSFLAMRASQAGTGAGQWLYALMDPLTGDSLSSPEAFLQSDVTRVMPDTFTYRLDADDFAWAPDSEHAALLGDYQRWEGGNWASAFNGLMTIDFSALLSNPLPAVPDVTGVVSQAGGTVDAQAFDRSGQQLWFAGQSGAASDLEYATLTDYAPNASGRRNVMLSGGFDNEGPRPRSPSDPAFFPPVPLGLTDQVPIIISVTPDPGGGFLGLVTPSDHGEAWPYPAVDAWLVNYRIGLDNVAVSSDGSEVSFDIETSPGADMDMTWFILETSEGTSLAAGPTVVNGQGQNIFVSGPLVPGVPSPMTLKVTPASPGGYYLYFYFLYIDQRVAFMTDHANPGAGNPAGIFTLRTDGTDPQGVTYGSTYDSVAPVWSPGREWIAFERFNDVVMCGDTIDARLQVYLVHPDGSNLMRVSQGMLFASDMSFNPSGRLLAYDCQPQCRDGTTTDICLYDLDTGTQKTLFGGNNYDFWKGQLLLPRWSPDGNYMLLRVKQTSSAALEWVYAQMDPVTGDSLSTLQVFIRGTKGALKPDGHYYRLAPIDFSWGPDSRHVAIAGSLLQWDGAVSWPPVFTGLAIFDFVSLIGSGPLPAVPDITEVVDGTAGTPSYPAFNSDASRLYYDCFRDSNRTDLQYTPLSGYAPVVYNQRINLLADGLTNRTPGLPRPVLPEFFPLVP